MSQAMAAADLGDARDLQRPFHGTGGGTGRKVPATPLAREDEIAGLERLGELPQEWLEIRGA